MAADFRGDVVGRCATPGSRASPYRCRLPSQVGGDGRDQFPVWSIRGVEDGRLESAKLSISFDILGMLTYIDLTRLAFLPLLLLGREVWVDGAAVAKTLAERAISSHDRPGGFRRTSGQCENDIHRKAFLNDVLSI